jgi:hypothetical protein
MINGLWRRALAVAVSVGVLAGAPGLAAAQAFIVSEPSRLSAAASPGALYARVVITPEFSSPGVEALRTRRNGKFGHLLWRDARGVAVTPKITLRNATGATEIPAVPVLTLAINGASDAPLASNQVAKAVVTPWVRLDQGMMIDVDFAVQGFNSSQWAAFSQLLPGALNAYAAFGGQWPKQVSDADIQSAGGAVDSLVNLVRDPNRNLPRAESQTLILDPLGNRNVGYAIDLRSPADAAAPKVGAVTVALEFQRSFAAAHVVRQAIPPPMGEIPAAVVLSNQLFKPAGGAPASVQSQAFYTALAHAVGDPKTRSAGFEVKCQEFRTGARGMAMSDFDVNLALYEALDAADWTRRIDLMSTRCFSDADKIMLDAAGRRVPRPLWPPPPGETIQLSEAQLRAIVAYLSAAEESDVGLTAASARFTDQIYVDVPDAFGPAREKDRQAAAEILQEWRVAGVVSACCSRPARDWRSDPPPSSSSGREHTLLLKPDPALRRPEYAFAVAEYWTTALSENRAGRVLVRAATEAEAEQARTRICGGPSPPAFLACTGAAANPAR